MNFSFFNVFLKNRNISSKIKRSKVTDYAALSKILNTFENIMENGAFALWSKCSIFHNIFTYIVFQRHQKVLSWSKGLRVDNLIV